MNISKIYTSDSIGASECKVESFGVGLWDENPRVGPDDVASEMSAKVFSEGTQSYITWTTEIRIIAALMKLHPEKEGLNASGQTAVWDRL